MGTGVMFAAGSEASGRLFSEIQIRSVWGKCTDNRYESITVCITLTVYLVFIAPITGFYVTLPDRVAVLVFVSVRFYPLCPQRNIYQVYIYGGRAGGRAGVSSCQNKPSLG